MSIAALMSMISSVVVARSLDVDEFGVYSLILSVQLIVALVGGFSLGTASTKFISQYMTKDSPQAVRYARASVFMVVMFSIAANFAYLALAQVIGGELYGDSTVTDLIPYSAIAAFSTALYTVIFGIVNGCQRIRQLALIQILVPTLTLVGIVFLIPIAGTAGVFVATSLAQLLVVVAVLVWLDKTHVSVFKKTGSAETLRISKKMLKFSFPALVGTLIIAPVFWFGNTELTLSIGFAGMGTFAASLFLYNALSMIPNSIVIPLMPRISELTSVSFGEMKETLGAVLRLASMLLIPVYFALAIFSDMIIEILYGQAYVSSTGVSYLMITAGYFSALSIITLAMITAVGRTWVCLAINVVWASSFVVLTFVVVPTHHVAGLGLVYALSYLFNLLVSFYASVRVLRVRHSTMSTPVAIATLFFTAGFLLRSESTGWSMFLQMLLLVGLSVVVIVPNRGFVKTAVTHPLSVFRKR
jgi:O-antigen/teichoic acid export membrane protein